MRKKHLLLLILLAFVGCMPVAIFPPAVDLVPMHQLGLVTFSVDGAEGQLDTIVTRQFLREVMYAQQGIEVVEMGTAYDVLSKIDENDFNQDAARKIGEQYGVTAFFVGEVMVSEIKPEIDLSTLAGILQARASFTMDMSARLVVVDNGATIWTDSVVSKENVAYLSFHQGQIPYFGLQDQDKAYRRIIDRLVFKLTWDFRPTKRRVHRR
jgi:hypothetical protein